MLEERGMGFSQENRPSQALPATILKSKEYKTSIRPDHNPLFTKFWQELRAGKGIEKGETDVEELVEFYTKVEPLSPLSEEEISKIKECLRQFFRRGINDDYNLEYKSIIDNEILLVDTKYHFRLRELNSGSYNEFKYSLINASQLSKNKKYKKVIESLKAKGVKALTLEEKIRFLNDPEFLKLTQYYNCDPEFLKCKIDCFGSGSRGLTGKEGGYYHSNEEFLKEVKDIRDRTGKEALKALDVGGNFGFALRDMKELDPNIETFNMTIDEHPSLFGDHIVRNPAEMMPREFEETMDIIDSQVAFRYFLYSDIALRNVVKALSVGGIARISYEIGNPYLTSEDFDKFRLTDEELKRRQKVLWTGIKTLVDQGYLDVVESWSQIKEGILNPDDNLRQGFIRFIKNKSTKNVSF